MFLCGTGHFNGISGWNHGFSIIISYLKKFSLLPWRLSHYKISLSYIKPPLLPHMKVLSHFLLSLSQQITLAYTLERDKEGYSCLVNYPREDIVISLISCNCFSVVRFLYFILLWNKVDLLCYVSFRFTAQSFSYAFVYFSQFNHSIVSNYFQPHGLQHDRLPCLSQIPGACSNSCP